MRPLETDLEDVCLCHWPVDGDALDGHVPRWLTVETADGTAWVTAVAHTLRRVRSFGVDLTGPAEAVTVRTPVRGPGDQRGVYFLAVFVADRAVDAAGSGLFGLPVRGGRLSAGDSDGPRRRALDVDGRRALSVRYEPGTETRFAPPDSLAGFLVERSRYYLTGALGIRLCGSVGHDPWSLATVDADVTADLTALGLPPADGPALVHYSPDQRFTLAPPAPVGLD